MSYGDAIASTSKAGEGDAVIFKHDGQGISQNVRNWYNKDGGQRQAQALQKQKFSYNNQASFYKNLQDIKAKIWDADLDEINTKINDDIIKYAIDQQKKGIDVFSDPQSMVELNGKLGQLSALANASKSAQTIHDNTFKQGIADDWKNYDDAKSYSELEAYKNLPIAQRALVNPKLQLRDFNPEEYINKNISPLLLKDLQPLKGKVYNDEESKTQSEEIQNGIIDGYKLMVKEQLLSTGRVTLEDAEIIATNWADKQKAAAFYNPTNANKLAFEKQKHDDMMAHRAKQLAFAKQKHEDEKKYNTPIPTYVTETMVGLANGSVTKNKFYGVPVVDPVDDGKGGMIKNPVYGNVSSTDNGKSLVFEVLDKDSGKKVSSVKIPVYNNNGDVVVSGTNVWQNINDDATANGISYGTEFKSNTKTYDNPTPDYKKLEKPTTKTAPKASQKTVVKKGYNSKTNQTQFIYSDGTKEIVNGKR